MPQVSPPAATAARAPVSGRRRALGGRGVLTSTVFGILPYVAGQSTRSHDDAPTRGGRSGASSGPLVRAAGQRRHGGQHQGADDDAEGDERGDLRDGCHRVAAVDGLA